MPGYFYDVVIPQARQALEDVTGVRVTGVQPYTQQVPTATPFGQQQGPMASRFGGMGVNAQMGPIQGGAQFGPNMSFQGANVGTQMGPVQVGAQFGPNMALQRLSGAYQRGPVQVGASYQPGAGVGVQGGYYRDGVGIQGGYDPRMGIMANLSVNKRFAEGGLATSIRSDPEYHARDVAFIDTRNQRLREMVDRVHLAEGGLAVKKAEGGLAVKKDDLSPEERSVVNYHRHNLEMGKAQTNEDGSVTTFRGAVEEFPDGTIRLFPTFWDGKVLPLDQAMRRAIRSGIEWPSYPDFDTALAREQAIHEGYMEPDIDRLQRKAKGGGVWTRKEGQNPEGGLNAKGRASLKAQGHDIKPPVSAKLAAKSPKAAARRKSFCARSAGQAKMFPEAARDPNSRLNKARRKWDC